MDDKMNYYPISREEWHGFYHDGKAPLTEAELDNIKSVNDQISLKDVQEIYVPLTHLIHLYMKEFESLTLSKGLFYMNMSLYHHSSLELPAVSPLVKAPPLVFCKEFWPERLNEETFNSLQRMDFCIPIKC